MERSLKDTECIILAGGFGTRLQSVVSELPKPMAPINGTPFLNYLLHNFHQQGIQHFILAIGHKSEAIEHYFSTKKLPYTVSFSHETEPLGTGGAIQQALQLANSKNVLIANGDSFFQFDLNSFYRQATALDYPCSVALKKVENSDRYGSVNLEGNEITGFFEKEFRASSLINAGIYLLDQKRFIAHSFPQKFSFEKDYLEIFAPKKELAGIEMEGYFIDIGIPEDYLKAQNDFKRLEYH